jgi:putative phosphoribosyl transferase
MQPFLHNEPIIPGREIPVLLRLENAEIVGDLHIPLEARGLVIFAHGSGSSRFSPRNRFVAQALNDFHLGTFLVDLLTPEEEDADAETGKYRFDIPMLAQRLEEIGDWTATQDDLKGYPVGLFGASTGAGAALIAAARRPGIIKAVVSRGGRPDLAGSCLSTVRAPTLLIVGERDRPVVDLNLEARQKMGNMAEMKIVPGATHLFEEEGALEEVSWLAKEWFSRHFAPH